MEQMFIEFIQSMGRETLTGAGAAIGATIVYLLNKGYSHWTEYRKHHRSSIQRLNQVDIRIYQYLAEVLAYTGGDRVYIVQFHNGTYYLNSTGQLKMSCTHEVVRDGISREQSNLQDLLTSRFPAVINEMVGHTVIGITTKEQKEYYYMELMKGRGVETCVLSMIKNGGIVEGYLAIDYLENIQNISHIVDGYKGFISSSASKVGYTLRNGSE